MKAKFLTGTYTLQSNKAKFNQFCVNPQCPLCKKLPGTREQFIEKGKRKVQGVPQSQTAALPRPLEEEETDKSKQAQTEQTYEKH